MKRSKKTLILYLIFLSVILLLTAIPQGVHTIRKHKIMKLTDSADINQVPYISTYYIKPVVKPNEEVFIDFYITDYNHSEYVYDDYSHFFSVTLKIPGKKDKVVKNLKAGDHQISLGTFNVEGETAFSLLCTDDKGRNSHELFNYFLVTSDESSSFYTVKKEDLKSYGLNSSGNLNYATDNSIGLQKLLDDKKASGYNGIKLYNGLYYVDFQYTIEVPDKFTFDLNGSTLKLTGFTGHSALMVSIKNKFDSHVKNGIIEGDYYEHDYDHSEHNSEWVMGLGITGNSRYCSFENLSVKDITGYGSYTGLAKPSEESPYYTSVPYIPINNTFKKVDIDRKTGEEIESDCRTTCSFIDLKDHSSLPYISISKYLGYQGIETDSFNVLCHFYDENHKFIKTIDGYQYRRIQVPENSRYIRVTLLSETYPENLTINSYLLPVNCQFKNIEYNNCRCVGLVGGAMNNMLIENCTFTHCGQESAKCALDIEDGWDLMQDVTFRSLSFYDNPNNDFLTCAGHNFIIENILSGKMSFWGRTNSYVVRNCNNISNLRLHHGAHGKSGYVRIFDNEIKNNTKVMGETVLDQWPVIIKNCRIHGKAENTIGSCLYKRCTIGKTSSAPHDDNSSYPAIGEGDFKDCIIQNVSGENHGGNYDNCTFENISGNLHGQWNIKNSSIRGFKCNVLDENLIFSVDSSDLYDTAIKYGYWYKGGILTINDSTITNKDSPLLSLPHYSLKKPITISGNTITSSCSQGVINFYDSRKTEWKNDDYFTFTYNTVNLPSDISVIAGIVEKNDMVSFKIKHNNINTTIFKDSDE